MRKHFFQLLASMASLTSSSPFRALRPGRRVMLFLASLITSTAAWAWDSEDNFVTQQVTTNFGVDTKNIEIWICYYNACGSDSYLPSDNPMKFYFDDEEIGSTLVMSGEDNDERDNTGNCVFSNTVQTVKNGPVRIRIYKYGKGHTSDGNEKWAKMIIEPYNLQYHVNHKVTITANWKRNQGNVYFYSNSHTVSVTIPEVFSKNTVMTSTRKGTNTFKTKYADTKYEQELTIYKKDVVTSVNGKSVNWGYASYTSDANAYYVRKSSGGNVANQAVELQFPSDNYTPVRVYPRNCITNDDGVKYHDKVVPVYTVHYPRSKNLQVTSDYWNKTVTLKWDKESSTTSPNTLVTDGKWMITRQKGNGSVEYIKHVDFDKDTYTIPNTLDTEYDTEYTYTVSFVPKTWGTDYEAATTDLLSEALSTSRRYKMERNFAYNNFSIQQQGTTMKLRWTCTPIALNKQSEFQVWRIINGGTATQVGTVPTSKNCGEYAYEDAISNLSDKYEYFVKAELLELDFTSPTKEVVLEGYSHIKSLTVTKGAYNDNVTLIWFVQQSDETNTYFKVERRVHSNTNAAVAQWKLLANTQGQDDQYTYVDTKAQNGIFYDYRVTSYCKTSNNEVRCVEYIDDIGFCSQTGTISGKITYDGGTAVDSVRVILEPVSNGDDDLTTQASLRCHTDFGGMTWSPVASVFNGTFGRNNYTLQMYLSPASAQQSADNIIYRIGDSYMKLGAYNAENDEFALKYVTSKGESTVSGITILNEKFNHLTFSVDNGKMTVTRIHQVDDGVTVTDDIQTATIDVPAIKMMAQASADTPADSLTIGEKLEGFIDDVRVFRRAVGHNEIIRDYSHYLSGKEKDLIAYWPFDDGIKGAGQAYDHSFTNGDANNNHADVKAGCDLNGIIPTASELSFAAVTDAKGDYIIQGVPYYNGGTNYSVRPVLSIHTFTPATKTCYFSDNSLVFSNSDFTDKSSFPVSGVAYYENTNHPVDDLTVYVDDAPAVIDGQIVTTAKDGTFNVNVPIGNHYIQLKKNNHTLMNAGRWPATGKNYFDREVRNLTFTDQTLVTVAGRIDGGAIEYEKPLGMGASVNNIGKAVITLTSEYNINAAKETTGLSSVFVPAKTERVFESPVSDVASTAVSGKETESSVKTITITTDPKTGEFAALLPPINYEIKSIIIPSNENLVFEGVQFPVTLSATNVDMVYTDSLQEEGTSNWRYFDYHTKYKLAYRTTPVMSFNQKGNPESVYGEQTYEYLLTEEDGSNPVEKTFSLYEYDEAAKTVKYAFNDAPIFYQNNTYTFNVMGYESYVNHDGSTPKEYKVPLEKVTVTASNEMSNRNYLKYDTGEIAEIVDGEFQLDSLGKGTYVFVAGYPRTQAPYTLSMSLTYKAGDVNYSWTAPGFADGKFKGIILGKRPYGNNFVTAGTDKLLMVLRDPPGSRSKMSWSESSTTKTTETHGHTHTANEHASTTHGIQTETKLEEGIVTPAGTITSVINTVNTTLAGGSMVVNVVESWPKSNTKENSYTVSSTISTSDDPMYDGPDADVYVGASSNYLFGMAKKVGLTYLPDGKMELGDTDVLSVGDSLKTTFAYTQYYIINTLIPDYRMMRNSMILPMGSKVTNNNPYYMYVSDVPEDDPNFGMKGHYHTVGGVVEEGKALVDSVSWCNSQIEVWEGNIYENEKAKVQAIANREECLIKNYSLSSGAKYDLSTSKSKSSSENDGFNHSESVDVTFNWENSPWGFSLKSTAGGGYTHQYSRTTTTSESSSTSFQYTLSDGDPEDAISVDVLDGKDGFSPIFYTRAGQTSGNWEPERTTLYYQPGKHTLMEQTMKNMVPMIYQVTDNVLTNVPCTGSAIVRVMLANDSETGVGGLFRLKTGLDVDGCKITCNGAPVSSGLLYYLGGQYGSKEVTLEISSVDKTALDCEVQLELVDMTQSDPLGPYPDNKFVMPIKVTFVPGSSAIGIAADRAILNSDGGGKVNVTLKDYDLNLKNLMNISLEYRGESDANWKTYKAWSCNKADKSSETILDQSSVTVAVDMTDAKTFPDQTYYFRARTMSDYGGEHVYNYSDEIEMLKDIVSPQLMGIPSPANGIYRYNTEVYATFNENIRQELITLADNVSLVAELNDGKISHEVSLACNGNDSVSTEAKVALSSESLAVNTWVRWNGGGGSIFAYGTSSNNLSIGVLDDKEGNKFYIKVGSKIYKSDTTLPKGEWAFLSAVIDATTSGNRKILCDYATADTPEPVSLIAEQKVSEVNFTPAKVTLGYGFNGNIHDLSVWDNARSFAVANSQKDKRLGKFTSHLVAYWPLNNGHGSIAEELVSEANIAVDPNNSWHIENVNYSVRLDKDDRIKLIPSANANTDDDDDYIVQMWFRIDKNSAASSDYGTLFSLGDGSTMLTVSNRAGVLVLQGSDGARVGLGNTDMRDDKWHHFSLMVHKSASANATAFIDGVNVGHLSSVQVGNVNGPVFLGGNFCGYIDEVRIANYMYSEQAIKESMYIRYNTDDSHTILYYPFEVTEADEYGQPVTRFSDTDYGMYDKGAVHMKATYENRPGDELASSSTIVPPLLSTPVLQDVKCELVTSDRRVMLVITESPERIEGCNLVASLRNISDKAGNIIAPVTWTFNVQHDFIGWKETSMDDMVYVIDDSDDSSLVYKHIRNNTGYDKEWTLEGLPYWMEASQTSGTLKPNEELAIAFRVLSNMGSNLHVGNIYLVEAATGISHPLSYELINRNNLPEWELSSELYENTMTIIGQVVKDNVKQESPYSMVAAFDSKDNCVGYASAVYEPRYDAYYYYLTVYGHESSAQPLRFAFYDSQTGVIYPDIDVKDGGSISFTPNKLYGSITNPLIWQSNSKIEQTINVNVGWNWISFNTLGETPIDTLFSDMIKYHSEDGPVCSRIINEESFSVYDEEAGWSGTLKSVHHGTMYKVNSLIDNTIVRRGNPANTSSSRQTIRPGWNWLGATVNTNMSLTAAMADMNAKEGDLIKDFETMSYYTNAGWVGPLKTIVPGKGYYYFSADTKEKQFRYPVESVFITNPESGQKAKGSNMTTSVSVTDYPARYKYTGTMTMIAAVRHNGTAIGNVELRAYDTDGEMRGINVAQDDSSHLIYIVLHGDDAAELRFSVVVGEGADAKTYDCDDTATFEDGKLLGTVSEPFVIDLDKISGINELTADDADKPLYDLVGRRVTTAKAKGIYIKNNAKVVK